MAAVLPGERGCGSFEGMDTPLRRHAGALRRALAERDVQAALEGMCGAGAVLRGELELWPGVWEELPAGLRTSVGVVQRAGRELEAVVAEVTAGQGGSVDVSDLVILGRQMVSVLEDLQGVLDIR